MRTPYRDASADFTALCEIDLALTYALRRPSLALQILRDTYAHVTRMRRPDLAYRVRELAALIAL